MSDTVYLVEFFYCDDSIPAGIFSRRELAEEWAKRNAKAVGEKLYGHCELDYRVAESKHRCWALCLASRWSGPYDRGNSAEDGT